jgi:hypothetical protein
MKDKPLHILDHNGEMCEDANKIKKSKKILMLSVIPA